MASPSTSQALTKRALDTALMPPPPPKRMKRPAKVLDEDTYTDALSGIIARDFFPGLLETETQQEYLDALDSQDSEWIAEAGRKLTQVMTPGPDGRRLRGKRGTSMDPLMGRGGETPRGWGGETPMSVAASDFSATSTVATPEVDLSMSLSSFQAKYTSEDNESFNALLDKQNAKRAERYAWIWSGNKIPSGRQIAHRAREAKLLEASKAQPSGDHNDQQVALRPTHPDDRKAMPDIRPSAPRNSFMFHPDSIEDTRQTVAQAAEAASNAPPRSVNYDNTRLPPVAPPAEDAVPPSPSLSAVNDAIAGRPRPTASEPGDGGSATPRVNGYAFVDAEPAPSEAGGDAERPDASSSSSSLLARLGASDASPNPFKIRQASRREELHRRMVERTARGKRTGGRLEELRGGGVGEGKTPVPKFATYTPAPGRGNLTPAAQRLLSRVGTPVRREGFGGAFDGVGARGRDGGRERWTPAPRLKR